MDSALKMAMASERMNVQSEANMRLLDSLHTFMAICVGDSLLYLNAAGAKLLGLVGPHLAIGDSFFAYVHPTYKSLAEVGLSLLAEETSYISLKMVRFDGADVDVQLWVSKVDDSNDGDGVFLVEAHDITEHLRSARALRSREQRLEGIINTVADGIVTLDACGLIQTFNPAAESIFGFSKEEVIGRSVRVLIPDVVGHGYGQDDPETSWLRVLGSGRDLKGLHKDGNTVPLEVAVRELRYGEQLTFTSVLRDVTARKAMEERLSHLAHHDALTGLPNRKLFGDRVEEAFKRSKRKNLRLALLFVDLDKFKPINDTYGHAVGDLALKEVAQRLRTVLRATDTVARVGGDEFMVLVEELRDSTEAVEIALKIKSVFGDELNISGLSLPVGASVGIAIYPDHGDSVASLMHQADLAMYRDKSGTDLCA